MSVARAAIKPELPVSLRRRRGPPVLLWAASPLVPLCARRRER
jgi:hypothetical protein